SFFFYCLCAARDLPSFPTRRSSDLALVELVYSAGLRSQEAVDLDLGDVDFEQELVHVRGKGGKERVVPLGEEAAHQLGLYLRERSEEHTSELQSRFDLVCRLLLEKK